MALRKTLLPLPDATHHDVPLLAVGVPSGGAQQRAVATSTADCSSAQGSPGTVHCITSYAQRRVWHLSAGSALERRDGALW